MENNRTMANRFLLLLLPIALVASPAGAKSKEVCKEPNPAQVCTAANTCGSESTPCTVDVERTGDSTSSKPEIPGAKSNKPFCIHAGTTVNWKSSDRNTGIIVDPGPGAPFDPDGAIVGGSKSPQTVVAKTPGCYKYSASACVSGAIKGMCRSIEAEVVILPK
jgi:hypothetical protein